MNPGPLSFPQGRQDPGCVCRRLPLSVRQCRFYPTGTPVQPDPVSVGHAVRWTVSSRYTTSTPRFTAFGIKGKLFFFSVFACPCVIRSRCLLLILSHQVPSVPLGQWRLRFALQTLSEALREVQAVKTAYPVLLSTGVKRV